MVILTKTSLNETFTSHREAVFRSSFPPPKRGEKKTFFHGFFLPFSLILTSLRHPTIGLSYLKQTVVRTLIVGLLAAVVLHGSSPDKNKPQTAAESTNPHPHSRNFRIDLDKKKNAKLAIIDSDNGSAATTSAVTGDQRADHPAASSSPTNAPTNVASAGNASAGNASAGNRGERVDHPAASSAPANAAVSGERVDHPAASSSPSTPPHPIVAALRGGWAWVGWFVGIISAVEGVVVFFSRRFDDWLGYWIAGLARVRPEDERPKEPKVAFDLKWLFKKLKRRIRGYLVFGAGVPLIACFNLIPGRAGGILFSAGLTIWGWYWLAVFTAAKSAHAWADDATAPSPLLIREIRDRSVEGGWWLSPFRLYGRLWGWLTKSVNSPAQMFERNAAPFLGMALARCILSLPGLYLLARPVIPVAASRLIAESDPQERFSLQTDSL